MLFASASRYCSESGLPWSVTSAAPRKRVNGVRRSCAHIVQRFFHAHDQRLDATKHLVEESAQIVQLIAASAFRHAGIDVAG